MVVRGTVEASIIVVVLGIAGVLAKGTTEGSIKGTVI